MFVMHGSVTSVVISAVPRCSFVVENIRVSPLSRTFLLNCRNCGYTVHTAWIQGDCGDVPCVLENKVPSVPHSAVVLSRGVTTQRISFKSPFVLFIL